MIKGNTIEHYGYIEPREFNRIFLLMQDVMRWHDFVMYQPCEPSILAACENPHTLLSYKEKSTGRKFSMQQTNQMHFEFALLQAMIDNIFISGLYGVTLSHRDGEVKRMLGRIMNRMFNMFEFEHQGNFDVLLQVFTELLVNLGVSPEHIQTVTYAEALQIMKKPEDAILDDTDEVWLNKNVAHCVLLTHFPKRTEYFWNMATDKNGNAKKCDIILGGMEIAGGGERSTDQLAQEIMFNALPGYAQKLYQEFGQDRVTDELNYYFSLLRPLSIRSGAGWGLSRTVEALKRYKQTVK